MLQKQVEKLVGVLRKYKFPVYNERELQDEIGGAFVKEDVAFAREVVLDKRNRIDFLVDRCIGVEIKVGASHSGRQGAMKIYKQLERYAKFPEIKALVLVTSRPMGLPELIGGKPAYYVSLGTQWL